MESAQYGKETRIACGKWKMEGKYVISQFFPSSVFGIIDFLFKINQNCYFSGNESDDNVKDPEVIVIDRLV